VLALPPSQDGNYAGQDQTSKVLCYIVRDGHLLVFRHAGCDLEQAGIQIPARSIRQGESPEDAAMREAREETGLSRFSVVRKLGETTYDISPYRFEIQHRHVFQLHVHEPTKRRWPSQELHDGRRPPTRLECFWIPLRNAHVLQAGQGALVGAIFEE
jgi:8-oxo-dGTP pyrophosphatase MutT (NUDIX family)